MNKRRNKEKPDERNSSACEDQDAPAVETPAARIAQQYRAVFSRPMSSGLYLVATPIGDLSDITIRALASLTRCDLIYAEDTRHTLRLLSHYGIQTRLRRYHEHNAERLRPQIMAALAEGKTICLVSDAGTPLISDPGYKLVRECIREGHHVEHCPGPSAVFASLLPSGLPTDRFLFVGFLPSRRTARREHLAQLEQIPAATVFFEAPSRVTATLTDMLEVWGNREAAIARELTKLNEEFLRGTLTAILDDLEKRKALKGEMVIVVAPPTERDVSVSSIESALTDHLRENSLRDAVNLVAKKLNVPRKSVYRLALRIDASSTDD